MIWGLLILVAVIALPLLIEWNRRRMDDTARSAAPGLVQMGYRMLT